MYANIPAIKKIMSANNFTQLGLANELGMSRATVNRVLNNTKKPGGKFMSAFKRRFPRENLDKIFYV